MGLTRGDLLVLVAVFAGFGTFDSAYLAWEWYSSASAPWCDLNAYFSCSRVRESPYSALAGVPTAWIGVTGFTILLGLALFGLRADFLGPWRLEHWIRGFAITGLALGVGLTVLEVVVINAICVLCAFGLLLDLAILGAVTLVRSAG